jgi:hypothetical protein
MPELNEYPYFPYPRDSLTRFGFLIGDLIAWATILGIAYIALKATVNF